MTNQLLTIPQAAERLCLSVDFTYRLAERGDLPVTRIGRRVLVSEEALSAFIASRTAEPRKSRKGAAA